MLVKLVFHFQNSPVLPSLLSQSLFILFSFCNSPPPPFLTEVPTNSTASYFLCWATFQLEDQAPGSLCVGDTASPACCILGTYAKQIICGAW